MNTFTDIGRVVADAELRDTGSGKVCSVRLAFTTGFGEKRGTIFVNASIWRNSEQLAAKLLKGTEVQVSGSISTREYTTRDGKQGQAIDLAVDRVGRIRPQHGAAAEPAPAATGWHGPMPGSRQLQDEIPF